MKKLIFPIAICISIISACNNNVDTKMCEEHQKNCPKSENCPEHPECEAHENCSKSETCSKHPACVAFEQKQAK